MTVSDQIIQVLDNLCEKFGLAIDWTSENVVPYLTTLATKLVTFEIWTSVAWLAFILIGLLAAILLFRKCRQIDTIEDEMLVAISIPVGLFGGAIAIAGLISQVMDIIKCLTFPEMYVFEYVKNLIEAVH